MDLEPQLPYVLEIEPFSSTPETMRAIDTPDRRFFLRGIVSLPASLLLTSLLDKFGAIADARSPATSTVMEMLVLGDSVVWGQGLEEKDKFHVLVQKEIERVIARPVRVVFNAHSGATILPKHKSCPSTHGEVPIATPTLSAQADAALTMYAALGVKADDVDLILLNGGINDVAFPSLINPFTTQKNIAKLSRKYCYEAMKGLLDSLALQFPKALIVVAGYYPMISSATDPDLLIKLIRAVFGHKSEKILEKAAKRQREESRKSAKLNAGQNNWLINQLSSLSQTWKEASNNDLQAAVSAVKPSPGAPQPILVKVDLKPEECYAAPNTHLWRITGGGGGVGNLITDDAMFLQRREICRLAAPDLKPFGRLICPVAGTGHPNVKGAKRYADRINQELSGFLATMRATASAVLPGR